MKLSYPIGMRGEAVVYMISVATYNCAKAIMQSFASNNPSMNEWSGGYEIEIDAYAHDVVRLVEVIEKYCDESAEMSYAILDDETQDWAASLTFKNHKLVDVLEEAVLI